MREKLNENPLYQAAAVGILLLVAGFFLLSTMGGKEEEGGESAESVTSQALAAATPTAAPPPGALAESAPPPPPPVMAAFAANRTVVLLFVRGGGIDDRIVKADVERLSGLRPEVPTFVVPADKIARYATITQGVDVNRVPALVVIRPRNLDNGVPTASVHDGYQSPESVVQAVRDAGYRGHTLTYHP